jgi:hypothetical protein
VRLLVADPPTGTPPTVPAGGEARTLQWNAGATDVWSYFV